MPIVPGIPTGAGAPSGGGSTSAATSDFAVVQYLAAWGLVLLLALLLNRSKWGHALIYYGLSLALLLLLVGNYQAIAGLLAPASQSVTGTPESVTVAPPTPSLGSVESPPIMSSIGPTAPIAARAPTFAVG